MGKLHDALKKAQTARDVPAQRAEASRDEGPRDRAPRAAAQSNAVVAEHDLAPASANESTPAQRLIAAGFSAPVYRGEVDPRLIPLSNPHSAIAEQYRALRTNLLAQAAVHKMKIFVVTSSLPGEGKSVSAANLACVLAEDADKKVVLIDADMRKPTQHTLVGVDNHRGLSDYLSGGTMLEMALQRSRLPNLWVLPAGHVPQNPTELLAGKRLEDLVLRLRRDYDFVVIDTPPVIATTDPAVLSPRVDGTLLVVRMDKTSREVVNHAAELLRKSRGNLIGTILTGLQGDVSGYYNYPYHGTTEPR